MERLKVRRLVLTVLVVFGGLVAGAVPASAATGYGDVCGVLGSPVFCATGSFGFPAGVAVDDSANPSTKGDVYVVDLTNSRVLKFNASGAPASFEFTGTNELDGSSTPAKAFSTPAYIAVGPTGDIYVENVGEPVIDVFNPKGEYVPQAPGGFAAPSFEGGAYAPFGVGVDQGNGDVYVSDRQAGGVIDVFEADGTFLRTFPTGAGGSDSVAVNSSGDVYVDNENTSVTEFSATGTPLGTLDAATPQAVAVDPSTQNVFVGENGSSSSYQIAEYAAPATPGEAPVAVFGNGSFASNGSYGIAVNGTTHHVYSANAAGENGLIFEEGPEPEVPVTKPASEVMGTTAMLHGALEPKGSELGFYFSYNAGLSCTGGGSVTTTPDNGAGPVSGSGPVEVSTGITGLLPSTHYAFCVFATNTFGKVEGSAQSFTTSASAPVVDSESSSGITPFAVTLEAQVNPENEDTTCVFQYGPTNAYGTSVACSPEDLGAGFGDVQATKALSRLKPHSTYHYRVVVKNATGTTEGEDHELTTLEALKPSVDSESASGITPFAATLEAQVNPNYQDTTCVFEYGTTIAYGTSVPCSPEDLGAGFGDQPASLSVTGLLANTTYHYRVVVKNAAGATEGEDKELTTLEALAPTIDSESAAGVTATAATLEAQVNPNYQETTCVFQYGTEASLTTSTTVACNPEHLGAGGSPTGASTVLTGLKPGETYYYRVVVENATLPASDGTIQPFTTIGAPVVNDQPPSVSAITRTTALLSGTVNSGGATSTYHFVYVDAAHYNPASAEPYEGGGSSAVGQAGAGIEDSPVGPQVLTGLSAGTVYHYALVASNEGGTTRGLDHTFQTSRATPPIATTGPVAGVGTTSATLTGTVNPQGLQTSYEFQVGASTAYGGAEIFGNAGESGESETVSVNLQYLVPGTTYHYRIIATNEDGTSNGQDMTFTTPGVSDPILQPPSIPLLSIALSAFPVETEGSTATTKVLTNAQKLTKALKACGKKPKRQRAGCRKLARKHYGTKKRARK